METGASAAPVSHRPSRRRTTDPRSRFRKAHSGSNLAGWVKSKSLQVIYLHWSAGSSLDLLRHIARGLDLEPSHFRGDLTGQISEAIVRLHKTRKQHPVLVLDEAQLLPHPALEILPLLLNFEMDSCRYLTLLLAGQPLLRRALSLQMHEALRQRIAVHYHMEGFSREELDTYLAQQLKA